VQSLQETWDEAARICESSGAEDVPGGSVA